MGVAVCHKRLETRGRDLHGTLRHILARESLDLAVVISGTRVLCDICAVLFV
jgi:hypothetical protein